MNSLEDKIMNIFTIFATIFLIVIIIFILVAIPLTIKETQANIKVKEKLAENGIEITTTQQISELLGDDK